MPSLLSTLTRSCEHGEGLPKKAGTGQWQVIARLSGLQQAHISRVERGLGNPTRDSLLKLAGVLGARLTFVAETNNGSRQSWHRSLPAPVAVHQDEKQGPSIRTLDPRNCEPDMWVETDDDPRKNQGPSLDGEFETLQDYLPNYRIKVGMKCDGMTPQQPDTRSAPLSTISLLGLIRLLAAEERD